MENNNISSSSKSLLLHLKMNVSWDYVSVTRDYVANFFRVQYHNEKIVNAITVASSELLENAIKYNTGNTIAVFYYKNSSDNTIELLFQNQADLKQLSIVRDFLKRMKETDSMSFYLNQMRASFKANKYEKCLGLARVNHETHADIKLVDSDFSKTNTISICAKIKLSEFKNNTQVVC